MEIVLPYRTGYDFGVGIDRLSGESRNLVVSGVPTTTWRADGIDQSFTVSRVFTTQDLQTRLGINIEASYGCASFGAGASARFQFMKESKIQKTSLFMTVTASIHLADLSIDHSVLTEQAARVVGQPNIFTNRYGNMFCRACKRGGLFVGILQVETHSEQDASEIEGALRGTYGLFSADIKMNFQNIVNTYNASVYFTIYTEGGPIIRVENPNDPKELLKHANDWMQAFATNPDQNAKAYEWTMSDISMVEGPTLNYIQIQHVQDILRYCARQRTVLLDQLNDLTWIVNHQDQYNWENAVSVEKIQEAVRTNQDDLDTISDCASDALNDVENAKMPAPYAVAHNKLYPTAFVPSPLPKLLPGLERVEVPGVVGWKRNEGNDKVIAAGLNPIFDMGVNETISCKTRILSQEPAPGTMLPRGADVHLYFEVPGRGEPDYATCTGCPDCP